MTALTRRLVLLAVGVLAAGAGRADGVNLSDAASGRMVLRFDIGPDRGDAAAPLLWITADGRFSVRAVQPGGARVQGRLAAGVLQKLVGYIVTTEAFLAISGEEISARIDQIAAEGGPMLMVADAPTTRLAVDLGTGEHAVTFYATGFAARLFPQIDALQRLRRIEMHLLQLAEGLRGGP